jgi:Outer membrane protein
MNHISKTLTITFLLIGQLIIGQDIYRLNLDSAIAIAKKQSYEMRYLRENLMQASYQLRSVTAGFMPRVDFNGYLPSYTETFDQYQDSSGIKYYHKKQSLVQGNLDITQQLPTDGKLTIGSNVSNTSNFIDSTKLFNITAGISLTQPLQALYAYNSVQAKYKQAKLRYELSSKQYKRQELDLIYNVSLAFYSLVSAEKEKEIAFQNLTRQDEAFKLAKNKYDAGLIKEVEALQIEVDFGEAVNSYDEKVTSYIQYANQLKQVIGLALKDSIITESKLEYQPVFVEISKALELSLKNRTEIREREIQIELSKLDIKSQKAQGTIQGYVTAYYNFIGINKYNLNYPMLDAFDETRTAMFNRRGNQGITLSLQVPILDWGANRSLVKLQKSRLEQNKLTLNNELITIENDLRNTVSSLQSSLRRLQLLEKNVKLAEKSYDISYQRFTNGDIDVESLGLDRQRFNNAKLSYLRAYISYKLLLLDLNRKTFYDFEKNVSLEP